MLNKRIQAAQQLSDALQVASHGLEVPDAMARAIISHIIEAAKEEIRAESAKQK